MSRAMAMRVRSSRVRSFMLLADRLPYALQLLLFFSQLLLQRFDALGEPVALLFGCSYARRNGWPGQGGKSRARAVPLFVRSIFGGHFQADQVQRLCNWPHPRCIFG